MLHHFQQWIEHSDRKINKETEVLNNAIKWMNLRDIHRIFHKEQQNTYSSQAHTEHSLA